MAVVVPPSAFSCRSRLPSTAPNTNTALPSRVVVEENESDAKSSLVFESSPSPPASNGFAELSGLNES